MVQRIALIVLSIASVTVTSGCVGSDNQVSPLARDSAGVQIIDYSRAANRPAKWKLVLSHRFGGDQFSDMFYRVRAVKQLSNGLVAVANGGSNEILWFTPGGALVRTAGGEGDGPGEFRSLGTLALLASDSLVAYDSRSRRFQVFDSTGQFGRSFTLDGPGDGPAFPQVLAATTAGDIVVSDLRSPPMDDGSGVIPIIIDVFRYRPTGAFIDSVASVPAWQAYSVAPVDGVRMSPMAIPWSPGTAVGASEDQLIFARRESGEVRSYDMKGDLQRIFRSSQEPPHQVTAGDIAAVKQRATGSAPPPAVPQLMSLYEQMPFPTEKPRLQTIHVGEDGEVWLIGWPSTPKGASRAEILDTNWNVRGTLEIPAQFAVHIISGDDVIGVWTDANGVEELRRYTLQRDDGS